MKTSSVGILANIPTEEVFTAPDRNRVDGYVTNKLPLSHNGNIIDGFTLTFKDGAVVDYKAEKGEDVLRNLLETSLISYVKHLHLFLPYNQRLRHL